MNLSEVELRLLACTFSPDFDFILIYHVFIVNNLVNIVFFCHKCMFCLVSRVLDRITI